MVHNLGTIDFLNSFYFEFLFAPDLREKGLKFKKKCCFMNQYNAIISDFDLEDFIFTLDMFKGFVQQPKMEVRGWDFAERNCDGCLEMKSIMILTYSS